MTDTIREAISNKPETGADFAATDGNYLAEIDMRLLTIIRASDGRMIAFHGRDAVTDFRACCRSHGPARAIATYLRIAPYQAIGHGAWTDGPYADAGHAAAIITAMLAGA